MWHKLISEYAIDVKKKTILYDKEAYLDESYVYFIIPLHSKEMIYMEQAALSYYLYENNYFHIAYPIPTIQGNWFISDGKEKYMVLKVAQTNHHNFTSHGYQLAELHRLGSIYKYEPQKISSYGKWKQLWIDKLTMFESYIHQEAKKHPHAYYQYVMDILPYIIGISENAIQYIAESEIDTRFHDADQGTITFQRYQGNLNAPIIWASDLVYDHPTRDLAEYIRFKYLLNGDGDKEEIIIFMEDYQKGKTLSIFSWRQLYARLIFPIHLFDCLEKGLSGGINESFSELKELVMKQPFYEEKLRELFHLFQVDYKRLEIPMLQWL